MRKRMILAVLAASGLGLTVGMMPARTSAAVIGDTFTNNTTDRATDKTLDGVVAEVGNATWGAYKFKFTDDNAVQNTASAGSAWVDTPTIAGVATAEADLEQISTSNSWGAIYLTNSKTTVASGFWDNIQLLINYIDDGSGSYAIYANGISNKIASGKVTPAIDPTHLTLIYDPTANTVSAKVNSTVVLSDYSLGAFIPDIETAGMFVTGKVTYRFDNFKLTVVPEPAGASLLLLGGLGVLGVRRRR